MEVKYKKGGDMEKERRTLSRVDVRFDVFLKIDNAEIPVKTWNLSMRGMQISADHRFSQGDSCEVIIALSPEVKIQLQGQIVRKSGDEAGVYFIGMGEDSFFHLKRLVQYNIEDPDKVDNELTQQPQTDYKHS